jgi:transposase
MTELDVQSLPETAEDLKAYILRMHEQFSGEVRELKNKILRDAEELALLRHRLFGRMSEKLSGEDERQGKLFNEAEATVWAEKEIEENVPVASHRRNKPGRRPLPKDLPREERLHDIPEDEKTCGCGEPLVRIGEETSEELEIVPARAVVVRHVRPKYACRACRGEDGEANEPAVKIAPVPEKLIPRSIASASLLAFVAVGKFADGLPFSRQEKQFERIGVDISRADMSNWIIRAGKACGPLIELMQRDLRSGPVVGADETPVQVHGEPGRSNTSESRMWVFRGGLQEKSLVLYQYHPTRSSDVPLLYLSGYQGFLQTDDYSGYDPLAAEKGIIHVGCWAHARRKFVDAQKGGGKAGSAEVAIGYIARIYAAEKDLRERLRRGEITPDAFARLRRRAVIPVLRELRDWYRKKMPQVPPGTLIGKALFYLHHEWKKLLRYLRSPYLSPDNNAVERAIRSFVVGRKAWLFAGCPSGAFASAALYSLIETAKANNLEPYTYRRFLFTKLPHAKTKEEYERLLPYNVDPQDLVFSF